MLFSVILGILLFLKHTEHFSILAVHQRLQLLFKFLVRFLLKTDDWCRLLFLLRLVLCTVFRFLGLALLPRFFFR